MPDVTCVIEGLGLREKVKFQSRKGATGSQEIIMTVMNKNDEENCHVLLYFEDLEKVVKALATA